MARDLDDAELVARVARGDEIAFTALMRRHEDRIYALALRVTGDRDDALEATQETFVTLWRKAATFEGRSQLGTWLYRVGINAAHDQVRKRRPVVPLEDAPEPVRPGDEGDTAGLRLDVSAALGRLPPEFREAVVMHDLGGIPYEQIAAETGAALGTVKSRISRGRRLLAAQLEHARARPPSKDAR